MSESDPGLVVEGIVKWYDTRKGFGFVISDAIDGDILLHENVLRNFGRNSIAEGSAITMLTVQSDKGVKAVEILAAHQPEPATGTTERPLMFSEEEVSGPLQPARVKWFDRVKGIGFANVFGVADDVFVHAEVLRQSPLSDLLPGEAIAVIVTEGERGLLATRLAVWEDALRDDGSDA
ncbi:cold-shock protein [Palleronia caenipelagi]|uniref:Cold shock domain-containing protein n=1 Tax=Palleronia caenipelagi TaxID=2489174 RepID=A0A547QB87_9RHOB|nr:cold shock domain-containing protein [Palleronia caenipelagi]TRD23620.1 cold shock domain-containing protein [Palleronia caenipelagi]